MWWEDSNLSTRQYGQSEGKQSYDRLAGEPARRLSYRYAQRHSLAAAPPGAQDEGGRSRAKYGDTYTVTATMEGESLSYWNATGTSGELPIYNAPNISVSDLSKTFDGVPITTNDALNGVTTASNGAVHVQL